MVLNTFKYKVNLTQANDKSLTASILSFIQDDNSTSQFNQEKTESVPVLLYHGVIDKPDGSNILLEDFKGQMFALKKAGWQTVSIEDFYAFMQGKKELPDKSFLLTFDDGRKDSYYPVDPILKALNYRATMFVITGKSLGRDEEISPFHLSGRELKKMVKSDRWNIQAHTKRGHNFYKIDKLGSKGHFFSNKLWIEDKQRIEAEEEFKARISDDFVNSKNDLENEFGIKVFSFAFPFGDFGQNSANHREVESKIVSEASAVYPLLFYQVWPGRGHSSNYPGGLPLAKRVMVKPDWDGITLLDVLDATQAKQLPYKSKTFGREWVRTWGEIDKTAGLDLKASTGSAGAASFLDGSYLWRDYSFFADVNWKNSGQFSLVARHQDNDNYFACTFSEDFVAVEEKLNGEMKVMAREKNNIIFSKDNAWLGAQANEDVINCFIGNTIVARAVSVSPARRNGGIGFKTWDATLGLSEVVVKEIVVSDISEEESILATLPTYLEKAVKELVKDEEKQPPEQTQPLENKSSNITSKANTTPKTVAQKLFLLASEGVPTPYKIDRFTSEYPWQSVFGKIFIKDEALHIGASASSTASLVVLSGSEEWTDYLFTATVDWLKGASFSLVARYKDSENHAICSYSSYGAYARLYLVSGGKTATIGKSPRLSVPYMEAWRDRKFSVRVRGDNIECLVEDEVILQYPLSDMRKTGGVGFKTWDKDVGNTDIAIKSVVVEEVK